MDCQQLKKAHKQDTKNSSAAFLFFSPFYIKNLPICRSRFAPIEGKMRE
jgi:hypothetical protein